MIIFGISFIALCGLILWRIHKIANAPILLENKMVEYERLASKQAEVLDRIRDYLANLNNEEGVKLEERFYKIYHSLYHKSLPSKDEDGEIIDYPIKALKKYTESLIKEFPEIFKEHHRERQIDSLLA
jgi:hypothetical protein